MSDTELTRLVRPRALPAQPLTIAADDAECAALARRFGVTAIETLSAVVAFENREGVTLATGTLKAVITQPCAVTQDALTYAVEEPLSLRFVPASATRAYAPDEEVELTSEELDEIDYEGEAFDIGEAIAQTLALAIDPYREGPDADAARGAAGIVSDENLAPSGPLAEALAALKK